MPKITWDLNEDTLNVIQRIMPIIPANQILFLTIIHGI